MTFFKCYFVSGGCRIICSLIRVFLVSTRFAFLAVIIIRFPQATCMPLEISLRIPRFGGYFFVEVLERETDKVRESERESGV